MEQLIKEPLLNLFNKIPQYISPNKTIEEKSHLAYDYSYSGQIDEELIEEYELIKTDIAKEHNVSVDKVEIYSEAEEILCSIKKSIPKTKKDIDSELNRQFERRAWYLVRDILKDNGFKVTACNYTDYPHVRNIDLYTTLKEEDFNIILDYYKARFNLI